MNATTTDTRMYRQQRWLAAHNAWNTTPPLNNQCKTITELLNYGVRGFALDVRIDNSNNLFLQHGPDNPVSKTPWEKIRKELDDWLKTNPREIVTLLFESYLKGPKPGETNVTPLSILDASLQTITGYKSGKTTQQDAILNSNFSILFGDGTDAQGNPITPHRLFAFLEKEPDEGVQDMFPVMTTNFAENVYGDASLDIDNWTNLRDGSNARGPLTFLNHFGNAPTGSEWDRNDPDLLVKHARAFLFSFGGRYPNFISLDYINWDAKNAGPVTAIRALQSQADVNVTAFKWAKANSFDDVDIVMLDKKITSFAVTIEKGRGIVKIIPQITAGNDNITAIQLVNEPGYGVVNMRIKKNNSAWEPWLTSFEKINNINDPNLATHNISGTLIGFCCRIKGGRGVVDFAAAAKP